jgi:hypothetical protein
MFAVLKPILYETVIWNDSLHDRLLKSLDDLDASEFRHTRYVLPKTLPPTRAKVLSDLLSWTNTTSKASKNL